jgi:toxin ParE1/3/4
MAKYKLSETAQKQIRQIRIYTTENWGAKQSLKYTKALFDKFAELNKNPKIGKDRSYMSPNLRSFPEGSHVIFYEAKKSYIEVVAILHENQDTGLYFNSQTVH